MSFHIIKWDKDGRTDIYKYPHTEIDQYENIRLGICALFALEEIFVSNNGMHSLNALGTFVDIVSKNGGNYWPIGKGLSKANIGFQIKDGITYSVFTTKRALFCNDDEFITSRYLLTRNLIIKILSTVDNETNVAIRNGIFSLIFTFIDCINMQFEKKETWLDTMKKVEKAYYEIHDSFPNSYISPDLLNENILKVEDFDIHKLIKYNK